MQGCFLMFLKECKVILHEFSIDAKTFRQIQVEWDKFKHTKTQIDLD